MIKRFAFLYLFMVMAAAALAADTPADPYGQLSAYEFGQPADGIKAIIENIQKASPADRAAIETKLLEAAAKPGATFACKRFVADMLRVVGSPACLPTVIKWLDDPKTADLATFALGGMPGNEVDAALEKAMRPKKGNVRIGLLQALAYRRDGAILGDLSRMAGGKDAKLAEVALGAMGTLGTPEAAEALGKVQVDPKLSDAREQAQLACARQMLQDGKPDQAKAVFTALMKSPGGNVAAAALVGMVSINDAKALPTLVSAMKETRKPVAVRAARLAVGLKGDSVTADLCKALPELAPEVQVALFQTLADRKDRAAFPTVKTALDSKNEAVRAAAVRACLTLGDPSVVQPLLALAGGTDLPGRAAREVLGQANLPGIDQALIAQLANPKADVAAAAAEMLARRGCRAAMPQLMKLTESPNRIARDAAFSALEAFAGADDVPALMAMMAKAKPAEREKLAKVVWAARRNVNPKDARFMEIWKSAPADDAGIQVALLTLGSLAGGKEPLKIIVDASKSGDKELKDKAMRAMFAWPDDSAAPATLEVIKTTDSLVYRVLALRGLTRMLTDKKATTPMPRRQAMLNEALAKLDRPEDKQQVQWALGQLAKLKK